MTDLERRAQELIRFNPHQAAREITGEDDTDLALAVGFTLLQENAAMKRMALQELGDTYRNMPWEKFKAIVFQLGFEPILDYRFPYKRDPRADAVEHPAALVAANVKDKLLLVANSFIYSPGNEVVDDCNLHATVRAPYKDAQSLGASVGMSVNFARQDSTGEYWELDGYPLEGLFMKIRKIEESPIERVNWGNPNRVISLGSYGEKADRESSDSVRLRFQRFVASCPPNVREFLT